MVSRSTSRTPALAAPATAARVVATIRPASGIVAISPPDLNTTMAKILIPGLLSDHGTDAAHRAGTCTRTCLGAGTAGGPRFPQRGRGGAAGRHLPGHSSQD